MRPPVFTYEDIERIHQWAAEHLKDGVDKVTLSIYTRSKHTLEADPRFRVPHK